MIFHPAGCGFLRWPRLNDLRRRDLAVRGGGDGLLPGNELLIGSETGKVAGLAFGIGNATHGSGVFDNLGSRHKSFRMASREIPSRLAVCLERLESQHVVVILLVPDLHQRQTCLIKRADVLPDDPLQPFQVLLSISASCRAPLMVYLVMASYDAPG